MSQWQDLFSHRWLASYGPRSPTATTARLDIMSPEMTDLEAHVQQAVARVQDFASKLAQMTANRDDLQRQLDALNVQYNDHQAKAIDLKTLIATILPPNLP